MLDARQIAAVLGLPVELITQLIKDRAKSLPTQPGTEVTRVAYADYVRIAKAAELTGYTERAINAKIDGGVWAYGEVWTFTPLGERVIIMKGYNRWVESGRASPPVKRKASAKAAPGPS